MPPTAVIELDRSEAWEPPERPGWSRRLSVRPVAVAAVLVVVLALVAGAGPVRPLHPPVVLAGDGVDDLRVDGDALFLLRRLDPARTVVESYRVSDGGRRWSSPVAASSEFVEVARGRVVLTLLRPGQETTHTLIALDAASGSQVWSRADYAPSVYGSGGGAGVVVAEPYREGSVPLRDSGRTVGLDIVTGDVRWSLVTPPGAVRSFVPADGGPASRRIEIAEYGPAGVLRLRSAESGAVVRTVTLRRPGEVDGFDVAGDRLLAYRFGDHAAGMRAATVFDLATGERLWQRTVEPGSEPVWWWWCGRRMCAGTETATAVLDPDTGRHLWRLGGWSNLDPLGTDRLLATRSAPTGEPVSGAIVLDASTGRILQQVDGWDLVSRSVPPSVLLSGRTSTGAMRIARLDVDTGGLTVLGRSEQWAASPQCVVTETVLACRHGPVSVWRIPAR